MLSNSFKFSSKISVSKPYIKSSPLKVDFFLNLHLNLGDNSLCSSDPKFRGS